MSDTKNTPSQTSSQYKISIKDTYGLTVSLGTIPYF